MPVAEHVQAVLAEYAGVPSVMVYPGASLQDDLDLDSLDAVQLAMELEDVYTLPATQDSVVAQWRTVADVIRYVEQYAGQG